MKNRLMIGIMFLAMVLLSGCGPIIAFLIMPLLPKPVIEAEYEMQGKKILVWVDIQFGLGSNSTLRRELSVQFEKDLLERELVKSVVEYSTMHQMRLEQSENVDLTVLEIGKQYKADQILHIIIEQYGLKHAAGKEFNDPVLGGTAKLIDVKNGDRLWPTDQLERAFYVQEKFSTGDEIYQESIIVRDLCKKTVQEITKYFYEREGKAK